ncbi:MAG TPA: hypothetical protein VK206_10185, partial [Anaerolineales bacterium]|nr:hypothetical protein [Anaerolineales bacterium]
SPTDLPEKVKKAREAATEFIPALQNRFTSADGSIHAGTILAAAAWLTGTSLYRAFTKENLPPGTIIKSKEINKEWESLMYLFEEYNFGNARTPVGQFMMAALAASDQHKPHVEMSDVQREFQERYNIMMKKHGFDYLDGARAGVILCSILFQQHCKVAKDIDPNVAAGIIAQGILEAAKTAPPPLEQAND